MGNIYTLDNPMPPLWLMYPYIHKFSIGWRMGYGESYKYEFNDWFAGLLKMRKSVIALCSQMNVPMPVL